MRKRLSLPFIILLFPFFITVITACDDEKVYTPKPRAWNYIPITKSTYIQTPDSLPYSFQYPEQTLLKADTNFLTERFWMNIVYPQFDATIQLSYKPIQNSKMLLRDFLGDSYSLTNKHQIKAYSIEEKVIKNEAGHTIVVEELEGEVPSQYQFFVTDSTENFFRAALYFKSATDNDSLAIVIDHIKGDMKKMMETFDWRKIAQDQYHNKANIVRDARRKQGKK